MNDPAIAVPADHHIETIPDSISPGRRSAGRTIVWIASALFALIILLQILNVAGVVQLGFVNWRPTLYAYLAWSVALGTGLVVGRGEAGMRAQPCHPAALGGDPPLGVQRAELREQCGGRGQSDKRRRPERDRQP